MTRMEASLAFPLSTNLSPALARSSPCTARASAPASVMHSKSEPHRSPDSVRVQTSSHHPISHPHFPRPCTCEAQMRPSDRHVLLLRVQDLWVEGLMVTRYQGNAWSVLVCVCPRVCRGAGASGWVSRPIGLTLGATARPGIRIIALSRSPGEL